MLTKDEVVRSIRFRAQCGIGPFFENYGPMYIPPATLAQRIRQGDYVVFARENGEHFTRKIGEVITKDDQIILQTLGKDSIFGLDNILNDIILSSDGVGKEIYRTGPHGKRVREVPCLLVNVFAGKQVSIKLSYEDE